jgi:hypothetical protein
MPEPALREDTKNTKKTKHTKEEKKKESEKAKISRHEYAGQQACFLLVFSPFVLFVSSFLDFKPRVGDL